MLPGCIYKTCRALVSLVATRTYKFSLLILIHDICFIYQKSEAEKVIVSKTVKYCCLVLGVDCGWTRGRIWVNMQNKAAAHDTIALKCIGASRDSRRYQSEVVRLIFSLSHTMHLTQKQLLRVETS